MTRLAGNPPSLPKRFYQSAHLREDAGFFALVLDGKPARTRARHPLGAASEALASAIADEWTSQGETIDLAAMPLTRFQMTAIDRGGVDAANWRAATLNFLASDLVCYRAAAPAELAARQAAAWDPLMVWARIIGVTLELSQGASFIEQPAAPLAAGAAALAAASPAEILAIKSAAEISGSAVIALALWRGNFAAELLFEASQVDETFQAEKWGVDAEAAARTRILKRDFLDAARYLSLTSSTATAAAG